MSVFVDTKALEIVQREIASKGGRTKADATGVSICCPLPNHDERTPSCHINLYHATVPVGWVYCHGCGHNSNWNTFAEIIGWEQLPRGAASELARIAPNATFRMAQLRSQMLDDTSHEPEWETVDPALKERILSPITMEWREIKPKLLKKLGCKRVIMRDGTPFIVIPIYMNGQLQGITRGRWVKSEDKKARNYINSANNANSSSKWVSTKALLGYDYIQKLPHWKKHRIIFLVEGPRDALKWMQRGIPAISILGNNWSIEKLEWLLLLEPRAIATVMDNDTAGRRYGRMVAEDCKSRHIRCITVKLPHKKKVKKKLDPAALSDKQTDKVVEWIMKRAA